MSEIEPNYNAFENQSKAVGDELSPPPEPTEPLSGNPGVSRTQRSGGSPASGSDSS